MKGLSKWVDVGLVLAASFFLSTLAHADTIYLSTANANTIDKFDSSGNGTDFATASSGLNWPLGLAFDGSGNLYVANTFNIEEFNSSGTGSVFATSSSGLSEPSSLAFDSSGSLYVANYNDTILKFSTNGVASVFATAASGLDYPAGLAFDSSGNLFVANYNNTILKFNTNGAASVFATAGLDNPGGLAFYGGNLYVVTGYDTIEEFNSFGQGSVFTSTNLLNQAIGLASDGSGDLFVANHGDGDILEFNPNGIGSVFAYGLEGAADYIAIEVPEPSSFLLAALAALSLIAFLKRKRP